MSIVAVVILLAFIYLVSTAAALLLSLMLDEDVKHRYLFMPVANTVWLGLFLLYMLAGPAALPGTKKRGPEGELKRLDGYLSNFSTFRPPWIRP